MRRAPPNPSLKRSANGRPPSPVWRYAVHFRQSGLGVLPSSPASAQTLGLAKRTVIYLQATIKARQFFGVGRDPFDPPGVTDSALGNWAVNVVPIGDRNGLLFT